MSRPNGNKLLQDGGSMADSLIRIEGALSDHRDEVRVQFRQAGHRIDGIDSRISGVDRRVGNIETRMDRNPL